MRKKLLPIISFLFRISLILITVLLVETVASQGRAAEPTGAGNPPPAMISLAEVKPESSRVFKNEHLGFTAELGPSQVRAIGFRMARERNFGDETDYYTLIYTPNLDTWQGTKKMELRISAIEPAELPELDITIADKRGEPPDETVAANSGPDTAVFNYNTSASTFPDAVTLVDEINATAVDKSFDKLILYAPPFCGSLMSILFSLVRTGGMLILPSGRTITSSTDSSGSFQTFIFKISSSPMV